MLTGFSDESAGGTTNLDLSISLLLSIPSELISAAWKFARHSALASTSPIGVFVCAHAGDRKHPDSTIAVMVLSIAFSFIRFSGPL